MSFNSWHWGRHKDNLMLGAVILVAAVLVVFAIEMIRLIEFYMANSH